MTLALRFGFTLVFAVLLVSCEENIEKSVFLPETPVFVSDCRWALAKEAYVRMKTEASDAAGDAGYLKKGDIVEIFAREICKDKEKPGYWLFLKSNSSEGWVHSRDVAWFRTKEEAANAASK